MDFLIGSLCVLVVIAIVLIIVFRPRPGNDATQLAARLDGWQAALREDFRLSREENAHLANASRQELNQSLKDLRLEMTDTLRTITEQNQRALQQIHQVLDEKITALTQRTDENHRVGREVLLTGLKDFSLEQRTKFDELRQQQKEQTQRTVQELEKITSTVEEKLSTLAIQAKSDQKELREAVTMALKEFQDVFSKNVESFNTLQREKFGQLEAKQGQLIESTEKKLEAMRVTVDEKLQKTLSERLGQSFELVGKQLESVQRGLGEMQTLAQDVGGLKRVLSNVKMRGGFGEVQLSLLLEQILAPDQYEANVRTKAGSAEQVEFAIKLPGRDHLSSTVWIPIDAKFPKEAYEQLQMALDTGDGPLVEQAQKSLEATIRKMAGDIRDKYIDPPHTTDFAILFLPFEGIYGEVVRKASLLEQLQRDYNVIVTGPTTLAAILNSLQMGFRTLAIQKRSSEVWQILGAVKKEFENFGGLLEKAQKNLQTASNQLDEVMGRRTRAIQRRLKGVEALDESEAQLLLPELPEAELNDEEPGE